MSSLELGPGKHVQHPDWVVVDLVKHPGVNRIADASDLPFDNEYFERIEAKNLLEHFPFTRTVDVLREWNRVLRKKGTILIVVPLVHAAIERYLKIDRSCRELNWGLMGGQRDRYDFHFALFDEQHLIECLMRADFDNIEVKKYYKDDYGNTCGIEIEAIKK